MSAVTGPLKEHQIAFVLRETLRGLLYLHNCGKMHRDVKVSHLSPDLQCLVQSQEMKFNELLHTSAGILAFNLRIWLLALVLWLLV